MEQTECSETSAYKIQTPGNYLKENTHVVCFLLGNFIYLIFKQIIWCINKEYKNMLSQ
jgi:hypothetical protein